MNKQNLTSYGSGELSSWFQNDEGLYNQWMRAVGHGDFSEVKELANELFIYTDEQLNELETDFKGEIEFDEELENDNINYHN